MSLAPTPLAYSDAMVAGLVVADLLDPEAVGLFRASLPEMEEAPSMEARLESFSGWLREYVAEPRPWTPEEGERHACSTTRTTMHSIHLLPEPRLGCKKGRDGGVVCFRGEGDGDEMR